MDFRYHLMNRRDVVAIFVDMDPSILLTDYALPYPLGENSNHNNNNINTITSTSININSSSSNINNSSPSASLMDGIISHRTFSPPQTRYEVLRAALFSFIVQKQRTSPSAGASLSFALYAVWDDVVELLPPTPGDSGAMEAALRQYLKPRLDPAASNGPSGPFPFRAVARALRRAESQVASRAWRGLTFVQGVVLVSRDGEMPIGVNDSPEQSQRTLGSPTSTACAFRRQLDIIHLSTRRQPLPAVRTAKERVPSIRESAELVEVDCPCTIVDLERFTGLSHRGLAVGCALARLLAPHEHRNEGFFFEQPVHVVQLPDPVRAPPQPQPQPEQQQQQQQTQQQVQPKGQVETPLLPDGRRGRGEADLVTGFALGGGGGAKPAPRNIIRGVILEQKHQEEMQENGPTALTAPPAPLAERRGRRETMESLDPLEHPHREGGGRSLGMKPQENPASRRL